MADGLHTFGRFLSDFGGGLNPQVGAANRQRDALAQDRQQTMAALIAGSLQKLDPTDPRNEQPIAEMSNALRQLGYGHAAVVRGEPATATDKNLTRLTKLQAKRSELEAMPQTPKRDRDISDINDTILKMKTITGTTEHDPASLKNRDKDLRAIDDARIAVEQNVKNMQPIFDIVNDPNYIGGTTGNIIKATASAVSQFNQLFGLDQTIDDADYEKGMLSRLAKAADLNGLEQSAVQELAYLHAKSLDPGGRISDKDIDAAITILGSGARKETRNAVLRRMESRLINNFNTFSRIKSKRLNLPHTDITREGVLGISPTAPQAEPKKTRTIEQELLLNPELDAILNRHLPEQ